MELENKLDLLVSNYNSINSSFKWDNSLSKHFGALFITNKDAKVKPEQIKAAKKIIEDNSSWISYFRGTSEFLLASMMSSEDNAELVFKDTVDIYAELKSRQFHGSEYLAIASFVIAKYSDRGKWNTVFDRMEAFYQIMKSNHFWLTSSDDYVFAASLALSNLSVESTMDNIEACYTYLKSNGLSIGNDLQNLSHILAFGEESNESKCNRALMLYNALKKRKCKLSSYGLSSLGVLTLISTDVEKIADEIQSITEHLANVKGYGIFSLSQNQRVILAASIVAGYYNDKLSDGTLEANLANSITAIIIAQQAAFAAAVAGAAGGAAAAGVS